MAVFQTRPAPLPFQVHSPDACLPAAAPLLDDPDSAAPLRFQLSTGRRKASCTFSLHRTSSRTRAPPFSASPRTTPLPAPPRSCASLTLAKPLPATSYCPHHHTPHSNNDLHDQHASAQRPTPPAHPTTHAPTPQPPATPATQQPKPTTTATIATPANPQPMTRVHSRTPDTRDPITCLKLLIAGASSAMVSRTAVAPLERVKMELVLNSCGRGPVDTALHVLQHEGVRGFWKGNALNILRTAPFKALNFLCFDLYHNLFAAISGRQCNSQRFAAGAAAGITATLLCFPLDVLRTRLLTPQGRRYGGALRTLTGIFKYEGRSALYTGVLPAVIAMAPAGAVFYGVYDLLKQQYLAKQAALLGPGAPPPEHLPALYTLLYGATAGAASEIVVYPLEVIRRRMQVLSAQRATSAGVARGSAALVMATSAVAESGAAASPAALAVQRLAQVAAGILRSQGVAGLYSGLVPNMLQVLPSAALSYFTYETVKSLLKVVKDSS